MVSQRKRPRSCLEKTTSTRGEGNSTANPDQVDELFSYEPLDPALQEIRLLTLSGRNNDDIECDIEIVSLNDPPAFTACSYTWSLDTDVRIIKVNEKSFAIGNTLWEFLHFLRSSQGTIKIWADSICIDQSDNREKSSQVFMMAEIYAKAERVISWLGDSGFNTRTALQYIYEANRQLQSGSKKEKIERDKYTMARRRMMRDLIDRKYWTRLWIIQETVRAKNLWVTTGEELLSWDDMSYWISRDFLGVTQCLAQWSTAQKIYLAIGEMRKLCGQSIPLPDLVDSFSDAACEHQHDKLYGLVALSEPAVRRSFRFDYSLPFLEVLLRNFHLWSSTDHARGNKSGNTTSSSMSQQRSAYTFSDVVSNLQKLFPLDDLELLRNQRKIRMRLTTSLRIKSMVLSQRTVYHAFDLARKQHVGSVHDQTCGLSSVYLVTIDPPVTSSTGHKRGDVMYSTVVPNKMDILLITGHTCFFVRKKGPSFHCVGTGLLIKSDYEQKGAPDPGIWTANMMPNIECDIVPNTWTLHSDKFDTVTCHVDFNGLAVAEIYRNNNDLASSNGFRKLAWDLGAYMSKLGLRRQSPNKGVTLKADDARYTDIAKNSTCVVTDPQKLKEIKVLLAKKDAGDKPEDVHQKTRDVSLRSGKARRKSPVLKYPA